MSAVSHAALKPPLTYDFTKRKRWADLTVTEVADTILLVLSPTCRVLHCGPAVTALLGWRDVDLIDCDLVDLINPDDQASFRASFNESVETSIELLSYVRLRRCDSTTTATSPLYSVAQDVLFELKGYPHFVMDDDTDCTCFFITAKPHPSRNTAMLNTFMELKLENERLQQWAAGLRGSSSPQNQSQHPVQSQANPIYATSSMHPLRMPAGPADSTGPYYAPGNAFDPGPGHELSAFDGNAYGGMPYRAGTGPSNGDEDGADEGAKKKKLKRLHPGEQYVCITCGRTDSPEWRKGPLGPKTLCNACGLRWAKQMRKYDDPVKEAGGGAAVGEGTTA